MKRKKAALFDPYLDTLGGGERHVLSIMKVLQDEGYSVDIFWNKNLQEEIKHTLQIDCTHMQFIPSLFDKTTSLFKKVQTLKQYDIFVYISDGSYFFSSANKNFVFAMIPKKSLYNRNLINRLKTYNTQFVVNSKFTQSMLAPWGINTQVLYPYIDDNFINIDTQNLQKDTIILSVGRFFKHLHSKRQDIAIDSFKKLVQKSDKFNNFRLILAGGMKQEDKGYFEELQKRAGDEKRIIFHPNISYTELFELYKKAAIYWHCAGYAINDQEKPESVEHLGISPLEAMAAGCLTFCYKAGGPKELIRNDETGYLFQTEEELIAQTIAAVESDKRKHITKEAQQFVRDNFSYPVFKKHVKQIIIGVNS